MRVRENADGLPANVVVMPVDLAQGRGWLVSIASALSPFFGADEVSRLHAVAHDLLGETTRDEFRPLAAGGSGGVRVHLYSDTIVLVAGRPLVGYGPDTFGLVYPSHSTGDWTPGVVVDKAHNDLLQVAATQGVLGVVAYAWLLATPRLKKISCSPLLNSGSVRILIEIAGALRSRFFGFPRSGWKKYS